MNISRLMKIPAVVLALLVCLAGSGSAQAVEKSYENPEGIYKFTYPADWKMQGGGTLAKLVVIAPPDAQDAFCLSRSEKSDAAKGAALEKLIDHMMTDKSMVEGIKAGSPDAGGFDIGRTNFTNGTGQRIIYQTADKKTSMMMTFNTVTGHTVDITCTTRLEKWNQYAPVIEAMQQSLVLGDGQPTAPGSAGNDMSAAMPDFRGGDITDDTPLPARVAITTPDFIGDNEQVVRERMKQVRDNITMLRMPDGKAVPPETAEELKSDVVPYEDAKRVMNRAVVSALVQYCGMDWENLSFVPFMENERLKHQWSDKQLAYIGGLHGATQGVMHHSFLGKGACTDDMKARARALVGMEPQ